MSDVVRDYSRTVMIQVESRKDFNRRDREGLAKFAEKKLNTLHAQAKLDVTKNLELHFAELEQKAVAEFRNEGLTGIAARSADLRYAGQGYEINVPAGPTMLASFHDAHRKRYGHADETKPVEVVNVRVRMIAQSETIEMPRKSNGGADYSCAVVKQKRVMFNGAWLETPVLDRAWLLPGNEFEGPAIVHEYSATTLVPPGCRAEVDEFSNIVIAV